MKGSGTGCEASIAAFGAHDNVALASVAPRDPYSEFRTLDSVDEWSLQCRLNDFPGNDLRCCGRTVHIEASSVYGCLHRHRLITIEHLILAVAP